MSTGLFNMMLDKVIKDSGSQKCLTYRRCSIDSPNQEAAQMMGQQIDKEKVSS